MDKGHEKLIEDIKIVLIALVNKLQMLIDKVKHGDYDNE